MSADVVQALIIGVPSALLLAWMTRELWRR